MRHLNNKETEQVVGGSTAYDDGGTIPGGNQPVGEWEEILDDILNGRRSGYIDPDYDPLNGG